MFPIRDARGRCIAFSGRILGDGEPKYLNSPDTPLFDKGRTLFNLDRAGPASRAERRVIVVEGQMDVVALDQAGMPEAVAPLGTALTEAQLACSGSSPRPLAVLRRRRGRAEGGGARGAEGACRMSGPGRSLGFVTLPAGQDPDDLVRAGGRAALDALLERPETAGRQALAARAATPSRSPRPSRKRACAAGSPTMPRRSTTPTCASNIASNCSSGSTT